MVLANSWLVLSLGVVCLLVIAVWVAREYGRRSAGVMFGIGVSALAMVYLSYEVYPIQNWRSGSLLGGLAVFAVPAGLTVVVALRVGSELSWLRRSVLIGIFWLVPALISYIPRLDIGSPRHTLPTLTWWSTTTILIYVLFPVVYAWIFRDRIRSYGLSLEFVRTEARLLLLAIPAIAGLVLIAVQDSRFQSQYPLYHLDASQGTITELLVFEVLYGLSFVALEFYFRGYMVHAGKAMLGVHAVPLMAFFYCLIHLSKPLPECVASLIGGLILGYVALKLRSIAVGVAAHLTLAWGVDAAVLHNR